MANKSKKPGQRKTGSEAAYSEIPLSFRVSARMADRLTAAGREIGMDRSEIIRYAVTRLILSVPDIVKNLKLTGKYPMELKLKGPNLAETEMSPEELGYLLSNAGEESVEQINNVVKRVDALDRETIERLAVLEAGLKEVREAVEKKK